MTVLLGVLAALLAVAVGGLLVPADRRRGVALVVAFGLLTAAGSLTVPADVRGAAVAVAAGVAAAALLSPRDWPVERARASTWTLAWFAWAVGCVVAIAPSTIVFMAQLAVVGLTLSWAVATSSRADVRVFLRGLVGIGVAQVVLGVVELTVTRRPVPWGHKVLATGRSFVSDNKVLPGDLMRVEGSVGHPIPYAVLLAVCLVVVVVAERGVFSSAARWAVVPVLSTGILLSGSRSVLTAVLLALGYVVLTTDLSHRAVKIVSSVSVVVVAGVLLASEVVSAVAVLVASGSYENRVGALRAVPGLVARPPTESLVGSGFGSEPELYARGLLPQEGFTVVDNQLVTTLATFGLIGLVLVVGVFVVGLTRTSRTGTAVTIVMATVLFSFDYLVWFSMSGLAFAFCALARTDGTRSDDVRPHGARSDDVGHDGVRPDRVESSTLSRRRGRGSGSPA